MKNILPLHRNLLMVLGPVLAICAVLFFLLIVPRQRAVATALAIEEALEEELGDSDYPLEAVRLEALLKGKRRDLEGAPNADPGGDQLAAGIKNRANKIVHDGTSMFLDKINANYASEEDFVNEVTQIFYEAEAYQLEQHLSTSDVVLSDRVLGLGEDATAEDTYKLVLQLWTVEKLVALVMDSGLRILKDPESKRRNDAGQERNASKIDVLEARSYCLNPDDEAPYLLEFPVSMTLAGSLNDFLSFLRSLHDEGRFLPISRMELRSENPQGKKPDSEGNVRVEKITVDIECSAFFRMERDAIQAPSGRSRGELPAGA